MSDPQVSVIIPAYNGANYLREAIQSVLDQTYPHFELIVVDDASPDDTAEVVRQFDDPRLRYIIHEKSQGAIGARKTGVHASSGEVIAFLDQDDRFHPEKLQTHMAFLEKHPEVGVTYNARFELEDCSKRIRGVWQPPQTVTLPDLVLGYPFAPSDTVLRRDWALREEIWDDSFAVRTGEAVIFNGGETVFCGRLALGGCKFASVGRVLNYRRYHTGRVYSHLSLRCKTERACQEMIFADPRCPDEVLALRNIAFMNTYMIFAYYAFAQDENTVGQGFTREAVRLNPSLLDGKPCELVRFLCASSICKNDADHEALLQNVFAHLPPELAYLSEQYDWAVARGYLLRGMRAIVWGQPKDGRVHFARAAEMGARIDEAFVQRLTHELLCYETEFGAEATQEVIRNLAPHLQRVGNRNSLRRLNGCYWINRAFQSYRAREYDKVPRRVIRALANDPRFLTNRGVLAILLRSLLKVSQFISG